jgi:LmeA-like phospholipid-binding
MSNDPTLSLPSPGVPQGTPPQRPRRRHRGLWITLGSLITLLVLLVVLDRVAVAYANNQAAQQIQSQGFPAKPDVSIEGFPFLTQVLARNLKDVHITANNVKEGPVTLSLVADATGVRLNPGFQSGTITHITGTGLIGFSSLASAAGVSSGAGLSFQAAGPDQVKITINLDVISASALATIKQTGPHTFNVRISSAGGIPASVLPATNFNISVPSLPYGMSIQSVKVTSQGVLINVTGSNIKFTQSGAA